jgi:hypothetical protein
MFREDQPESAEIDRLPDELAAFEERLVARSIIAVGIDRDRLMFAAGRAAAEAEAARQSPATRGRWAWPAATAVSLATAASLALLLVQAGPPPQVAQSDGLEIPAVAASEQEMAIDVPPAIQTAVRRPVFVPLSRFSYLADRELALAYGVDSLEYARGGRYTESGGETKPAPTMRELIEQFISKSSLRGRTG